MEVTPAPTAPPATCPIGWQPQALAPVFFGARSLGSPDGAPVPLRVFFPSLDGSVESAPLLEGCGRYPLVLFAHGHCQGDTDHYDRWFRIPAQLARAGYVVVVPHLAGNAGGESPSVSTHPDEETLDAVLSWARSGWEHAGVLLSPPATGVVGHSFGAMLGARFAVGRPVSAYAGLSGTWQDWFGDEPFPLPLLDLPTLLVWGGASDLFTQLPEATWQAMARPRHRVVFAKGEHWDYIGNNVSVPCRPAPGPCPHVAGATADLLTMFLGRYLPPELATDLAERVRRHSPRPCWTFHSSRSSSQAATSAGSTRWAASRRARWPSTAPSSGSSRTPAARRPTPSTTRAPGSRGSQHGTGGWSRPVRLATNGATSASGSAPTADPDRSPLHRQTGPGRGAGRRPG
jgi:dienelactone hydrolase